MCCLNSVPVTCTSLVLLQLAGASDGAGTEYGPYQVLIGYPYFHRTTQGFKVDRSHVLVH